MAGGSSFTGPSAADHTDGETDSGDEDRDRSRRDQRQDPRSTTDGIDRDDDGAVLPRVTPDRQVLVVGDGIAGLSLAAFLERDGGDPVLLSDRTARPRSAVTTLPSGVLSLLDEAGVDDALRTEGFTLDEVTIVPPDGSSKRTGTVTGATRRSGPVVVSTTALRASLEEAVGPSTIRLEGGIDRVSERRDGLEVEFDNGVREQFDVVVAADGVGVPGVASGSRFAEGGWDLTQYERRLDGDALSADAALERWHENALLQAVPTGERHGVDGEWVVRVTVAAADVDAPTLRERTQKLGAPFDVDVPDAAAADGVTAVRQGTPATGGWHLENVAACGRSAFPVAPATGIDGALSVGDAWVLADELRRDHDDVRAALRDYAARRHTRIERLLRLTDVDRDTRACCIHPSDPLHTVSRLRTVSLAALCSPTLAARQRDLPGRL